MPRINVCKPHKKSPKQVRKLADQLAELLEQKYRIQCHWQGDTLAFKEKGISGDLNLKPGEVQISITTGLLMAPLTKTIESELNKALDQHLA